MADPVPQQHELVVPYPPEHEFDAPLWRIVIADLAGNPIGEIVDAYERKVHFALRTPETVECKLTLDNAMLPLLLTPPHMHLWKVYRGTTLMQVFETSSWEFATSEDGLTVCAFVATTPFWTRLAKRLIGKNAVGVSHNGDRHLFVSGQLAALNLIDDTRLRMGTVEAGSHISVSGWRYKPMLEAIQELANTVNGFDFYARPAEPTLGYDQVIDVKQVMGQSRPEAIFEYGDDGRANIANWSWKGNNMNRLNGAVALPTNYPDNAGLSPSETQDSSSISDVGLREMVVSSELDNGPLRDLLTQEHVAVRKHAQQIFTFNPHFDDGTGRVPQFPGDFGLGDTITGRVNDQGLLVLDGEVRVYGVDIELSDEGLATTSLTLVDEG